MSTPRRAVRALRRAANPVPSSLSRLDRLDVPDASPLASADGHAAWQELAHVVDRLDVIDAVDDHVLTVIYSCVNLGVLTLDPDVHERLIARFDKDVRPALDAEVARRAAAAEGERAAALGARSSNVEDHVWLYRTTRVAAALDPAERDYLQRLLPQVLSVGLSSYRDAAQVAVSGRNHAVGASLVLLAVGGALWQSWQTQAVDLGSLAAVVGSLAAVAGFQAHEVGKVRASGMRRAFTKDEVARATDTSLPDGSLARLREDVESRRVALRTPKSNLGNGLASADHSDRGY